MGETMTTQEQEQVFDLERKFSCWLLTEGKNLDFSSAFNPQRMTLEAVGLMRDMGQGSIEQAFLRNVPAIDVAVGAYLSGVFTGFVFREHLAQQEELSL
jgi:hypothetical protein